MRGALAGIVLALALAPVAAAASAPLVPLEEQAQMKSILSSFNYGALEFVPTKAPAHYTYTSNVVNTTENLITLQDGAAQVSFTAQFFNGKIGNCGRGAQVTIKVAGVKVYSKGGNVWRCLKTKGKVVKLSGSGAGLSREDLGMMIATAKPF